MKYAFWIVAMIATLSACSEKPQALVPVTKDTPAYSGTGKAFVDSGWKQGDKASWESHMKARTQQGQNDYGKIN